MVRDYEIFEPGEFTLQSGITLPGVRLAYKTYGTLNVQKSNVIVYPTAFADQHYNNEWLIGEGMALDPNKYFIIVPNALGNGLSSSPSNTPPPFDRANFPHVTIYDDVRLQHQLLTQNFGIEKIALVTGWSLGALQTFQWGASYPEMVERIAPFCGTAKTWPHTFVFFEGVKAPLLADASWSHGQYTAPPAAGLRAIGRVYAGWGFSQAFYREACYWQLGYQGLEDFLAGFWDNNFLKQDANDLLAMLKTGQQADLSANAMYQGDFEKALKSIKARAVIMPARTDLYFTIQDSEYESGLMPRATFRPIESIWGHFAGRGINPVDTKFIDDNLKALLAE
ncbi:alpha/beta fold hydrolase [Ktedonosporobacter rubrisoli]|uniref:Alpha/beta fold hydrolase n=1 Tax=Ktedonosporobacter rubrisoli TaxID=2509675 RepID=A0A4P6JLR0_KTERU|nr:alpha/beta fold hydrolase [Ktedonosporobacter rubrisoli]QBD76169.1 alpha/beta fold hydrolase [Ktedonosporobacter rubrisoli]